VAAKVAVTETRPVYLATTPPVVLTSREEAIERARALGPALRSRTAEAEALRRLPDANVAAILENGLCGIMTPKLFGGSELGSEAMIDVTIELARSCAATGWVHMLWTAHMWMLALFPPAAQEELWSNPSSLASSVVSTVGDVLPVEGGYRWTGRGFFSSGVDHCNWLTAVVPIKREGEQPTERRWMLLPREDLEIVDDWRTVGLRGTGSKSVIFEDIFIPDYRTVASSDVENGTTPGGGLHANPMYRGISFANFTAAMAAPAVGAAVGFLAAFEERLRSKVAGTGKEVNSPYLEEGLGITIGRYAAAAAQLDSVRALLLANAHHFSRVRADQVGDVDRARCRRDQTFAAQSVRRVVNGLYEECGGTGLLESSDLQRIWRDVNAAAAHRGLTWDWQAEDWPKAVFASSEADAPDRA
jgi:3-hydroxy-9,10-secoandrosta-1,3,5(10)-triene-9,17-dione monooxygenase